VGGAELPEGFDLAGRLKEIGFTADQVELVGSGQGFFEVRHQALGGANGAKLLAT